MFWTASCLVEFVRQMRVERQDGSARVVMDVSDVEHHAAEDEGLVKAVLGA